MEAGHSGSSGAALVDNLDTPAERRCLTDGADDMSDEALVALFQQGNNDAFTALHSRYSPVVYGQCLARLHDRHLADEAAQETFVRALAALQRFDGGAKFRHYLLRVAKYVCRDIVAARRTAPVPIESFAQSLRDDADVAHISERRHSAGLVLGGITARDAALLRARHLDDRSTAEVAALFGVTPGSAAVLLSRARSAARRVARERGIHAVTPGAFLPALVDRVRRWFMTAGPPVVATTLTAVVLTTMGPSVLAIPKAPASTPGRTEVVTQAVPSNADVARRTRDNEAAALAEAVKHGAAFERSTERPASEGRQDSAVVTPIPGVAVPGTTHRIDQDRPQNPDYAYGVEVGVGPSELRGGIEADDEGEREALHRTACELAAATPHGYCER
jgi:RNA polymerase sigma-70 factor (ECF subfamily)